MWKEKTSRNLVHRVRNLKFARNLKLATSKTLVYSMKKMMVCLNLGIFQFKEPSRTIHSTNLTLIRYYYQYFYMWLISNMWQILDFLL